MRDGHVDAAWAKQHHLLWYEELKEREAQVPPAKPVPGSTRRPVAVT
jgi:cytochrome b subunit of formate dehydrogenase